ncbi:MAG: ion transporter [Myxococcota bacterium]|nr:ion transporter [Myxococcota bacterium]
MDGFVWVLIIASIILLGIDLALVTEGAEGDAPLLEHVDQAITWLFTVEIVLRVATHRPPSLAVFRVGPARLLRTHIVARLRYCLQPLVLVDILAVLAIHPALRGLRALRLLRLLRGVKLFRYANPLLGVFQAFRDSSLLYAASFSLVGGITVVGGLSFYLVERAVNPGLPSLRHAFWWAIVTLTTVGYGDISPVTGVGQAIGAALMVAGMFTLALFAGVVGHTLLNTMLSVREEQFRMSTTMHHVIVCGWDPGARMLLDANLAEIDPERQDLVIFAPGERPRDVPLEYRWVSGDPTKESELPKARPGQAHTVLVVGNRDKSPQDADARTLLTLFTIRRHMQQAARSTERRRPLYLIAEVLDAENVEHARAAGADEVIETTRLGFSMLAHAIVQRGTGDVLSRITAAGAHSLYVGRVPDAVALPATFSQVARAVKVSTGALVIGLVDHEGADHVNPPDDAKVHPGMAVVYLAESPVMPPATGALAPA